MVHLAVALCTLLHIGKIFFYLSFLLGACQFLY